MRNEFKKHLSTPDKALAFAKELRNQAAAAKNRFFEFLVEIEKEPKLWNLHGPTFATFLTQTHLTTPSRFADWKKGREMITEELSDKLGFHATRAIARVEDESDRRAAISTMTQRYEKEGRVALSNFAAKNAVEPYIERPRQEASKNESNPKLRSRSELLEENKKLRKENKKLRMKIQQLEKECERLRASEHAAE